MNSYGIFFFMLTFVGVAGCAPYSMEPLSPNHPAHPEALTLPGPPASNTLAYTEADLPSALPVQAASTPGAKNFTKEAHGSAASSSAAPNTVVGEGNVVAVVPSSSQIVLDHGEIKNFMDAMTMGYRVVSPELLEGLQPGIKVRFTIDVDNKAIIRIEKLSP